MRSVLPTDSGVGSADPQVSGPGEGVPLRLGPDVALVMQDDLARLLDLNRGRFFALNASGSRLLVLALQSGPAEAVRRVARDCDMAEEDVRADWTKLLGTLRRRRLVATEVPAARRGLPGRLRLGLLFTLAWISLRLLGWARTLRLWRLGRTPAPEPWQGGVAPLVQRLDQAILVSAATHPLSLQCKERAVVAWHILRNRWNLPAVLVIGVMPFPFEAHAWVECGPMTVTEERARCETFQRAIQYH